MQLAEKSVRCSFNDESEHRNTNFCDGLIGNNFFVWNRFAQNTKRGKNFLHRTMKVCLLVPRATSLLWLLLFSTVAKGHAEYFKNAKDAGQRIRRNLSIMTSQDTKGSSARRLNPRSLPSLVFDTITLQLPVEDSERTFDGVLVNEESWYGTERDGSGIIHLVRPHSSSHLEGQVVTSEGGLYSISTHPRDGSIYAYDTGNPAPTFTGLSLNIDHQTDAVSEEATVTTSGDHDFESSQGHRLLKKDKIEVDIMILYTKRAMCAHTYLNPDCETKGPEGKKNREAIEAEALLNLLISNVAFQNSNSSLILSIWAWMSLITPAKWILRLCNVITTGISLKIEGLVKQNQLYSTILRCTSCGIRLVPMSWPL